MTNACRASCDRSNTGSSRDRNTCPCTPASRSLPVIPSRIRDNSSRRLPRAALSARRQNACAHRIDELEREILQLAEKLVETEPVGNRCVNLERLASDAAAFVGTYRRHRLQIVMTIGELDQAPRANRAPWPSASCGNSPPAPLLETETRSCRASTGHRRDQRPVCRNARQFRSCQPTYPPSRRARALQPLPSTSICHSAMAPATASGWVM
jgi:hypothetical protein